MNTIRSIQTVQSIRSVLSLAGRPHGAPGVLASVLVFAVALAVPAGTSNAQDTDGERPHAWRPLFNGENLDGWTAKIVGYDLGDNHADTFRVVDGLLTVSYDGYDEFSGRFGHLFHDTEFSNYRLRAEYRFIGEQAKGGPGWAFRNSGLMLHGQSPASMAKDQEFPASIEVQLLGGRDSGERSTANLCTPGTDVVMNGQLIRRHCSNSRSKTYRGDQWVTVEVEVRGDTIRHIVEGDIVLEYDAPQLDERDGDARKLLADGRDKLLRRGTISLQSESHPIQFRSVEILELGAPGAWVEPLRADSLGEHCETKGNWQLENGVATLVPRDGETGWRRFDHYLWLDGEYAEFEAEFDYKLERGGNSGFYFHVGDRTSPVQTGIEVQIYDTPGDKTNLTDHDSGGFIPGGAPARNAARPAGAWNHVRVSCEDGTVRVTLNGTLVNQIRIDHERIAGRPGTGAIGFQDHSKPMALRNVRVRRI